MSASAMFAAELESLGVWFPEGDGDALRVSADAWNAAADLLEDIGAILTVTAGTVVDNHHGDAAGRFAELWARWSGPAGYLATTVADCRRVAAAVADFATDVDVADRALLRLIEQALDTHLVPTLDLLDELWRTWLAESALALGTELGRRADVRAAGLAEVGRQPILSADERAAIDPARVTWPDLSAPADLTFLATTPVDLGAGQGELPVVDAGGGVPGDDGGEPLPDDPVDGGTVDLPGSPTAGGINIVINGDGNTITIETPSYTAPLSTPPDAFDGDVLPDPLATDPHADATAEPGFDAFGSGLDAVPTFDASAYEPSTFDPSTFDAVIPPAVASAPARLAELDTVDAFDDTEFTPATPIIVDPPGRSGLAAAAGATAAAAATTAAKSGRAPFFPFMPMGGGAGGGDESPEPKRRVIKKRRVGG